MPMTDTDLVSSKQCVHCHQQRPISDFRKRTGKRSKGQSRRGTCRDCRKLRETKDLSIHRQSSQECTIERKLQSHSPKVISKSYVRGTEPRRSYPRPQGPNLNPQDPSTLAPSAKGIILMRGHSDKGKRWHQEIDLALAVILVKEHAAVVINRRTIRRIYSNKEFRTFILTRDNYTCYFCGLYGDTIDHLLPRAKGGHTTPDNCVCACNLCNQTKADQYLDEFMGR